MTTITELQELCGTAARDKGFHDDRPDMMLYETEGMFKDALTNWQGNKLMLIVSEVAEAQDELRKGNPADVTYYVDLDDGPFTASDHKYHPSLWAIPAKPEGVPSELADVVIRVLDFCYTEGIDLETIIEEKLSYNATRAYKHGKKF